MRFALTVVLLAGSSVLAQTELPPNWNTSQGDPIGSLTAPGTKAAKPLKTRPAAQPSVMAQRPAMAQQAVMTQQPAMPQQSAMVRPPAMTQPAAAPAQPVSTQSTLPPHTLIDISAPLDPRTTPVYEGNPPIQFSFTADINRGDALDLSLYSFGSHTGTHVDAPLHFLKNAATIDQIPLPQLVGMARVIDVDPRVTAITAAELNRYHWQGITRILFRTRNSVNNWIVDPVFHRDFVYLAPDAAEMLAEAGVELVGIDYLSVEQFGAASPQAHINLLKRGCIIAEGLDLRTVQAGDYKLTILPLKIMGHEAAPARAILETQ